ncbi:adenylyl-sulfate kinase [Campylobacter hepaticus]|uniref:Adenylyl-sulfate kinase n=1 Tax=Campylobacter hepaticus TaxID=1813019 RepID=A0A424YYJ3_9BACT|nr:adenylyl-sulfate kinase [Campylobacter hepaticus]AXP09060.1 adenylyl-sulfate kinase [Campylobacter hepaticus]MPV54835.1 adenylyl-sulfate kinase [Campylobacter hepaticus]MPV77942.1 adenylyl-sulfate kinase [Campylobacter hepaticus]MPV80838.1 adenylyl-sulfate kinase [Campylobacter hepaticus]MPV81858.1 adenylyl-sulfate kinase [Campylobacter hepaticus]
MNTNLTWHNTTITKIQRSKLKKQKPCVIWLTGLSGSGKSTLANALDKKLFSLGYHTYILDGDNIRHGINKDLGFDESSRVENIRRIAELCKLFVDSGLIIICAFISPFENERNLVRSLVEKDEFIEIFVDTPLEICEKRDPKGLYKKARNGEIKNFTGIDSPYEKPQKPEIYLINSKTKIADNVNIILDYLKKII